MVQKTVEREFTSSKNVNNSTECCSSSKKISLLSSAHHRSQINNCSNYLSSEPSSYNEDDEEEEDNFESEYEYDFDSHNSCLSLNRTNSQLSLNNKKYILNDNSSYKVPRLHPESKDLTSNSFFTHFQPKTVFTGHQYSRYRKHKVSITFNTTHLNKNNFNPSICEPNLSGILTISGLTRKNPKINTSFDGYIIDGNQFGWLSETWPKIECLKPFITTAEVDMIHWEKFNINITWKKFRNGILDDRYICMKWKERCLIDENNGVIEDELSGASYDGFYYIVLDLELGIINGYYYHDKATQFQEIRLNTVDSGTNLSVNGSFELA